MPCDVICLLERTRNTPLVQQEAAWQAETLGLALAGMGCGCLQHYLTGKTPTCSCGCAASSNRAHVMVPAVVSYPAKKNNAMLIAKTSEATGAPVL